MTLWWRMQSLGLLCSQSMHQSTIMWNRGLVVETDGGCAVQCSYGDFGLTRGESDLRLCQCFYLNHDWGRCSATATSCLLEHILLLTYETLICIILDFKYYNRIYFNFIFNFIKVRSQVNLTVSVYVSFNFEIIEHIHKKGASVFNF